VKFSILYIFILLITKGKVNKKIFPCPGRGPQHAGALRGRPGSRDGCYAAADLDPRSMTVGLYQVRTAISGPVEFYATFKTNGIYRVKLNFNKL